MSINFCFMYFEALLLDINNYDCFVFLMNCTVIILKCFFFAPVVISVLQFLPPDINIVTLVFLHLLLIFSLWIPDFSLVVGMAVLIIGWYIDQIRDWRNLEMDITLWLKRKWWYFFVTHTLDPFWLSMFPTKIV